MFPCASFSYGLWWIFPLFMLLMIVLCFFMMRGGMGSMICRGHGGDTEDSALDTLKKRYARGELNRDEYEQQRREIVEHN